MSVRGNTEISSSARQRRPLCATEQELAEHRTQREPAHQLRKTPRRLLVTFSKRPQRSAAMALHLNSRQHSNTCVKLFRIQRL